VIILVRDSGASKTDSIGAGQNVQIVSLKRNAMNEAGSALGALMLDLEGPTLTAFEQELLQRPVVGGLILFSRNYVEVNQLRDLMAAIREVRPDILIAVDQEGGRVQRLREGFAALPSLHAIARYADRHAADHATIAATCGWAMAAEVLHYGIDFSFAPVLDLYDPLSPVIRERAFAAEPARVAELARAYIKGMHRAGMAATGKHFPGHGLVRADSHVELPTDNRSLAELRANDMVPFVACRDVLDAVMPAHVLYPQVDAHCAGFSRVWIQDQLRRELDFNGVVFSDDLSMVAAHGAGSATARAEKALTAGCDMVLVCNDRACALTVADWLETRPEASNTRLPAMRARPAAEIANLYSQTAWQEAKTLLAAIAAQSN
jgi:beta-N-acetylhexosaminidase